MGSAKLINFKHFWPNLMVITFGIRFGMIECYFYLGSITASIAVRTLQKHNCPSFEWH